MIAPAGREARAVGESLPQSASFLPLDRRYLEREHNLRVAKSWKCRPRVHDWEDRENPETHAHYKVYRRCDAYRQKRGFMPGPDVSGNFHVGGP
jgi:hypothetical protein